MIENARGIEIKIEVIGIEKETEIEIEKEIGIGTEIVITKRDLVMKEAAIIIIAPSMMIAIVKSIIIIVPDVQGIDIVETDIRRAIRAVKIIKAREIIVEADIIDLVAQDQEMKDPP